MGSKKKQTAPSSLVKTGPAAWGSSRLEVDTHRKDNAWGLFETKHNSDGTQK